MAITVHELVAIGDSIVASIGTTRLENDGVLRAAVERYQQIRSLPAAGSGTMEALQTISAAIRDIEARLDIVSPD